MSLIAKITAATVNIFPQKTLKKVRNRCSGGVDMNHVLMQPTNQHDNR